MPAVDTFDPTKPPSAAPTAPDDFDPTRAPGGTVEKPRHPWADRVGGAVSTLAKDFVPNEETLTRVARPGGVGEEVAKVVGDAAQVPLAAYGGLAEHAQRSLERPGGFSPTQVHPNPAVRDALTRMIAPAAPQGTGQFLQNAWNTLAGQSGPQRAKTVGDVAEIVGPPPILEGVGALADAAKISRVAKEYKVSRATAEAMLKAGIKRETPVKPGIVERVKGTAAEIKRASQARKAGDTAAPISPEDRAEGEKIGRQVVKGLVTKRDPTGKLLTANPAEAMGKPTTAAEALGPTGETRLGATARREGQTAGALQTQLAERLHEAPQRIQDDFGKSSGLSLPEIEGDFRTANQEARTAHTAEYVEVNPEVVPNSEQLTTILARPHVKTALREAYDLARGDDVNPEHIGLIVSNTKHVVRNQAGELEVALHTEPIEVRHPTIQTLDYLKRGLQESLEKFRDPITHRLNLSSPKAHQIAKTLDELRDLMFKASPKYEALMAKVGDPIRQGEAFNDAPTLFSNQRTSEYQFGQRIKKMSDPEKRALLSGAINDVFVRLRGGRLKVNQVLPPSYRAKVAQLVGQKKADELFARLEEEARGHGAATRMMPKTGSGTFGWAEAAHETDQDVETARGVIKHAPHVILSGGHTLPHAILSTIAERWQKGLDLTRVPINEAARDEIGRLLMMKPSELHEYVQGLDVDGPTKTRIEKLFGGSGRARLMGLAGSAAVGTAKGQEQGRGQ